MEQDDTFDQNSPPAQVARWVMLARDLVGDLSELERADFDQWVASDPDRATAVSEARRSWSLQDEAAVTVDLESAVQEMQRRLAGTPAVTAPSARQRQWRHQWWPRIAVGGGLLVAGMAAGALLTSFITHRQLSSPPPGQVATSTPQPGVATPLQMAMATDIEESKALLTAFESKSVLAHDKQSRAATARWASDLLSQTRILLDSPAARDPDRRALLADLELVLVQIVQLDPQSTPEDRKLVESAIAQARLLSRLNTYSPNAKT